MVLNAFALVVDDSQVARMMIKGYIQDLRPGWTVHEAASGEEALQMIGKQEYDLITLDFNMPNMDGLEVAQQLRQKNHKSPIVLITANIQSSMQTKAAQLNLLFVKKPVDQKKIEIMLDQL